MTTVNKNLDKIRWRSEVLKNLPRGLGPVISLSWPISCHRAHPLTGGVSPPHHPAARSSESAYEEEESSAVMCLFD
jgi:hypothetical protein